MVPKSQLAETYLLKRLDEIFLEVTPENIVTLVYQILPIDLITLDSIGDTRVVTQTEQSIERTDVDREVNIFERIDEVIKLIS